MKEHSYQKIYEKIIKYTDLTNKNVREIGCGDGRISSLLSEESDSLIAVDPDEKKIRQAKTHILGVDFRIGSGEKLNFPNRVLKTGGKILVLEPVVEGEIEQVFAFLRNENNEKRKAQKSIIDSGLSILDSEIFTTEWIFRDKDDLLQSVFQYYDHSILIKNGLIL